MRDVGILGEPKWQEEGSGYHFVPDKGSRASSVHADCLFSPAF